MIHARIVHRNRSPHNPSHGRKIEEFFIRDSVTRYFPSLFNSTAGKSFYAFLQTAEY
jgi:hypothetical protein